MVGCENKFLTFKLGKETYALPICPIAEIIRMVPITKVPKTEFYVVGVINLRGEIITVIDGRKKLQLESKPYDDRTCIIIMKLVDDPIGLIVDNVEEVIFIEPDVIKRVDIPYGPNEEDYIKGISEMNGEIKIILNDDKLFRKE